MARYTGPKNRIARRFGANIFGRIRNPMLHKQNPPGQHGARRRKKSDFGVQLEEKQKLRAVYGMVKQHQLLRYYQEAHRQTGNTSEIFLQRLECRLDNIVYRLKFAPTIFAAQQLVAHGHILVNGKKVDIRSFFVRPGMVVSVREASKNMKMVQAAVQSAQRETPEYLSLDVAGLSGTLLADPHLDQVSLPLPINVPVVCEYLALSN